MALGYSKRLELCGLLEKSWSGAQSSQQRGFEEIKHNEWAFADQLL